MSETVSAFEGVCRKDLGNGKVCNMPRVHPWHDLSKGEIHGRHAFEPSVQSPFDAVEELRSGRGLSVQECNQIADELASLRATLEHIRRTAEQSRDYVDEGGNLQYQQGVEDTGKAILLDMERNHE